MPKVNVVDECEKYMAEEEQGGDSTIRERAQSIQDWLPVFTEMINFAAATAPDGVVTVSVWCEAARIWRDNLIDQGITNAKDDS